jgi:hypothetical protein
MAGATANAGFSETSDRVLIAHMHLACSIGLLNPPTRENSYVPIPDGPRPGIELDHDRTEGVRVEVYR